MRKSEIFASLDITGVCEKLNFDFYDDDDFFDGDEFSDSEEYSDSDKFSHNY